MSGFTRMLENLTRELQHKNSSECLPRLEVRSTCKYHKCPFPFCVAFLLICVIWQSGFYTCPMDKGCIQWIVVETEVFMSNFGELQT